MRNLSEENDKKLQYCEKRNIIKNGWIARAESTEKDAENMMKDKSVIAATSESITSCDVYIMAFPVVG